MTERDLFFQYIPQIAEIITVCRKMTAEEYMMFKKKALKESSGKGRSFIKKVFFVVEKIFIALLPSWGGVGSTAPRRQRTD